MDCLALIPEFFRKFEKNKKYNVVLYKTPYIKRVNCLKSTVQTIALSDNK
jgi:hypothetical protein